jgi:hypothetical protein
VPERRGDLVFLQNGIVRTMLPVDAPSPTVAGDLYPCCLCFSMRGRRLCVGRVFDCAAAVLYFSVLERGGEAKDGGCTYVSGRFSSVFAGVSEAQQ